MMLNLVVWLVGLLISAIPIIIVFSSYFVPGANDISGQTFMDVARQAYPNMLFVVIAVSGVAIAESILVFFRMVETGQQRATAALWLLCSVLLIIFGAISYGQVAGSSFIPSAISSQQISYALGASVLALAAAISLRHTMIQLEVVARQQILEEAAAAPIDLSMERSSAYRDLDDDPYDLSRLQQTQSTEDAGEDEPSDENNTANTVESKTTGKSRKKS